MADTIVIVKIVCLISELIKNSFETYGNYNLYWDCNDWLKQKDMMAKFCLCVQGVSILYAWVFSPVNNYDPDDCVFLWKVVGEYNCLYSWFI